jgi:hypothetical protein
MPADEPGLQWLVFKLHQPSSTSHHNYSLYIRYLQHYTRRQGWMFKHFIGNEDWLSSAMHMHMLSQGVLLNSSVNSESSPGWP